MTGFTTRLRRFRDANEKSTATTNTKRLRAARVAAARSNPRWTELDEGDLVARGPLLVSASSDRVYKPHTGVVFERSSSNAIADHAPLHWYERDDGDLVFLELLPGTWSERYEKQLRRRRTAS